MEERNTDELAQWHKEADTKEIEEVNKRRPDSAKHKA